MFRRPRYDDYCFSRIPWTIEHLLGDAPAHSALPSDVMPGCSVEDIDRVVLVFVDGFGWQHFERYLERYPLLQRFVNDGVVSKLTAMFPSTTTAHVTGIHTGLAPAQSGLYEWFQYHEGFDAVIAPLLFSYAGEQKRDGLLAVGADPKELFHGETVHERLARAGVTSRYVTPAAFTPSPYNDQVCRGAQGLPYTSLEGGLATLSELVGRNAVGGEYLHFYFGEVDAASHQHGLYSAQMENAVEAIFTGLDRWLVGLKPPRPGRTMLLLTADHGMTPTFSERTIYLNQLWPELEATFERNDRGAIVPAGSPRDFFLHVRDQEKDAVIAGLRARLDGVAEVYATRELIDEGFFGLGEPSILFLRRVGNVVILPYQDESVWWFERGRFENAHRADHGGLTPAEMDIPLAALVV